MACACMSSPGLPNARNTFGTIHRTSRCRCLLRACIKRLVLFTNFPDHPFAKTHLFGCGKWVQVRRAWLQPSIHAVEEVLDDAEPGCSDADGRAGRETPPGLVEFGDVEQAPRRRVERPGGRPAAEQGRPDRGGRDAAPARARRDRVRIRSDRAREGVRWAGSRRSCALLARDVLPPTNGAFPVPIPRRRGADG